MRKRKSTELFSLDIGCGHNPKGNVNVDLFLEKTEHRGIIDYKLNPKNIKNFVLADSQFLPFRNNVFNMIKSDHVIEHIKNPFQFLKEAIRVTRFRGRIRITCPHRYSLDQRRNRKHISSLSLKWLETALKILKMDNFEIKYSNHFYIPFLNQADIILKIKKSPKLFGLIKNAE